MKICLSVCNNSREYVDTRGSINSKSQHMQLQNASRDKQEKHWIITQNNNVD